MIGRTFKDIGKLGFGLMVIGGFVGCESPPLQETNSAVPTMSGKADDGNASPHNLGLTCSNPPTGHDPNGIHDMGESPHFEGWYYRATDDITGASWVLIVAYWVDKEGETKGFVEAVEAQSGRVYKKVYSDLNLESIQSDAGDFFFEVGNLIFTYSRIVGDFVADSGETVFLDWRIDNCALWGAPEDENNRWTMG